MKINNRLSFLVLLVFVLALPSLVLAQILPRFNITITGLVVNIGNAVWKVAAGIMLILWVITGILFLTALGDASKLTTAKSALFAAVGGTAVTVLAYSATALIINALGLQ